MMSTSMHGTKYKEDHETLVFTKVQQIISELWDLDQSTVSLETHVLNNQIVDSFDLMKLYYELENAFDIELEEEELEKSLDIHLHEIRTPKRESLFHTPVPSYMSKGGSICTIQSLVDYICNKLTVVSKLD